MEGNRPRHAHRQRDRCDHCPPTEKGGRSIRCAAPAHSAGNRVPSRGGGAMTIRPTTIRARLTLWFASAIAVVLIAFAAVIFLTVRTALTREVQRRTAAELQGTAAFV